LGLGDSLRVSLLYNGPSETVSTQSCQVQLFI
jgi:hypothetical protein